MSTSPCQHCGRRPCACTLEENVGRARSQIVTDARIALTHALLALEPQEGPLRAMEQRAAEAAIHAKERGASR